MSQLARQVSLQQSVTHAHTDTGTAQQLQSMRSSCSLPFTLLSMLGVTAYTGFAQKWSSLCDHREGHVRLCILVPP
eukprot:283251-Prymnesium_polylepis.1